MQKTRQERAPQLLYLLGAALLAALALRSCNGRAATATLTSLRLPGTGAIQIAPGVFMPIINLGTCCGSESTLSVPVWLEAGGKGIDTAYDYGPTGGDVQKWVEGGLQTDIRDALEGSPVTRSELFITSKVPAGLAPPTQFADYPWGDCTDAYGSSYEQVQQDLVELGIAQLDLVLLHAPCSQRARNIEQWRGLEAALADGLTRAIGVSNYNARDLALLLEEAAVPPAVNQCKVSLNERDEETIRFALAHNITTQSWGLFKGCPYDSPDAIAIAAAHSVSVAQVCLRWGVQRGFAIAVGLGTSARMAEHAADNMAVGSTHFELSVEEMQRLEATPLLPRHCSSLWHAEDGYVCSRDTRH